MSGSIRLTYQQAADALCNVAVETDDQMVGVLVFTSSGEILRRRQEVEDAIDDLSYADLLAFEAGPFGHDLVVLRHGLIFRYDVPTPVPVLIPAPDRAQGRPDMQTRLRVRRRFLEMFTRTYTTDEATAVCNEIRAERDLPPVDYPYWMMQAHELGRTRVPMDVERFATGAMFVALGMAEEYGQ